MTTVPGTGQTGNNSGSDQGNGAGGNQGSGSGDATGGGGDQTGGGNTGGGTGGGSGSGGNGSGGGSGSSTGGVSGAGFATITGNEKMVEGDSVDYQDGSTRRRDEQFTADWSLVPTSAELDQVFVGDVLVDEIIGDVHGTAHLTYMESGTNFTSGLDCPTENYSGHVEWDTDIDGTYSFVPSISQLTIDVHAVNVSSPSYDVPYTYPGCTQLNSTSPSSYFWGGPGIGVWGGVAIVISNGTFDDMLDNPLGNDLGDADYYQIHAETTTGQ